MSKKSEDQLLRIIDRSINPSLKIAENVTLTPNIPGSRQEWSDPLKAAVDKMSVTLKPAKNTSIKLGRNGESLNLTLTKKF